MEMMYIVMAVTVALMLAFWLAVTGLFVLIACIHDWRSSRTADEQPQSATPAPRAQQPTTPRQQLGSA